MVEQEMVMGKIKLTKTEFNPQILEEPRPPVTGKSVTINLDKGLREFLFRGNWTGNDVRIVQTAFFRQYRLYQREMRRNAVKHKGDLNG